MIMKNKRLVAIVLSVALLLVIPLVAMLFTNEVNWTPLDFMVAAVLLLGAGLSCEFVLRKVKKMQQRIALCGLILAALFVIWVELAVGIF